MLARFLIPILFILLLDVYGFLALRTLFVDDKGQQRQAPKWFVVAWWSLPIITFAVMLAIALGAEANWPKSISIPIRAFLFIGYFAKFVGVLFLLIDDLRRLVQAGIRKMGKATAPYWPDRSRFLTQIAVMAGALPAVVLSYGIIRNAYRYQIHEVAVPIKGLSPKLEGFRIAQISDIHSGSFFRTDPIMDGIRALNDLAPDVACFTGDLVNSRATEIEPYIDIFSKIESRYGTYSIIGNHDYGDYVRGWTDAEKEANWQTLYRNHERLGWDLMLNEHRLLSIEGEPLALIGVENWSSIGRFPRTGDLDKATKGTEQVFTKVLLSHDPTHWDAQVVGKRSDIQLQLSGHTHGFQFGVEIPGFKWSPSQYLYDQWAGLYSKGNQHLYVNRGYGFLGYPGRVGILPEVTLLTLTSG